ncbi:ATPase, T2SS/T4P/T4SS family, partial [Burkholderia thailandensis]|uniref:ATPase, T2SS/T4P/T4SS family n=1 Tax=Burkholderia thailandensis TaxID=57975 RepID=UPI003F689B2C
MTIRDLVKNSLRMRPDRIIVGEVRGGETLDMLQAMNTGHDGSLVTVHANNPLDAVSRLETWASMCEVKVPFESLRHQINSAVDLIVQLGRGADGSRRMTEVAAVTSESREEFELTTLMKFESEPLTADRIVRGSHVMRQIPDNIADRLWISGNGLSENF